MSVPASTIEKRDRSKQSTLPVTARWGVAIENRERDRELLYWYSYDANNRALITQGELNATTQHIDITHILFTPPPFFRDRRPLLHR